MLSMIGNQAWSKREKPNIRKAQYPKGGAPQNIYPRSPRPSPAPSGFWFQTFIKRCPFLVDSIIPSSMASPRLWSLGRLFKEHPVQCTKTGWQWGVHQPLLLFHGNTFFFLKMFFWASWQYFAMVLSNTRTLKAYGHGRLQFYNWISVQPCLCILVEDIRYV